MLDNPYRFLEQQAAASPDAIALLDGAQSGTEITFGQLLTATDSLAGKLAELGIEKGSIVALRLEKKWAWIVTLALWRLGATAIQAASMGTNFEAFGVTHVVTQSSSVDFSGPIIVINQEWLDTAFKTKPYGRVEAFDSDCPFPIIALTSGTTGKPKRVPITTQMLITRAERAATRNLTDQPVVFLIGGGSHFGQLLNLICLMRGWPNCVFLARPEAMEDLPKAIDRFGAETLAGAPGQIQMALATVGGELKKCKSLKRLYMGGAIIPERLRDQAISSYGWQIFTAFASTEVGTTTHRELRLNDGPRNLGYPVEEAQVEIVDDNDLPVAEGQLGRLRVKTDVMIQAYPNDESATAKTFREGWFYPGDRAKWLPTGEIFFEGREGEAINLGGQKVDPSVIDEHVISHPKVRDAASFGIEVRGELRFLACAVVISEPVEMKELIQFTKREFGDRSPLIIFTVNSIPRNEMNKVQRAQLTRDYSRDLLKIISNSRKK